ncbi:MAG: hypothetical protein VW104_08125 [Halieaceae bacterium]|jgi:uncharacterized membrane protein
MSFAQSDFAVFQNALVYTVAVRSVNKIVDNRDGSVLTLLVTACVLTFFAQVAAAHLRDNASDSTMHLLVRPLHGAGAFVCSTLVSVGINMQSTLLGTYLAGMFASDADPLFVLAAALVGLVLLWVLGVAVGAVSLGR